MSDVVKKLLDGTDVRETILAESFDGLFEMANIPANVIDQKFDIWVDSVGADRNVQHNDPRLKVEFTKGVLTPVSISKKPEILSGENIKKNGVRSILKFIGDHSVALKLHFNKVWSDPQIIYYLRLVGKKHKTIPEALQDMLEDDEITEIPKEFNLDD